MHVLIILSSLLLVSSDFNSQQSSAISEVDTSGIYNIMLVIFKGCIFSKF